MADLREQLNAIVDRLDHLDGHDVDESEELEWAVKQLKTLAAQPAPAGEVALPEPYTRDEKFGFPYWGEKQLRAYGDARAAAAASRPATAVPEHVRRQVGKLDAWRLCMSHNDSYFGEPAGLVKSVVMELAHAVDPIYPEPVRTPDPLAGVVVHLSDGRTLSAAPQPAAVHGSCSAHCAATGECTNACAPIAPQPAAVKQDLTTAQEDPCPNCTPGVVCKTPKCGRLAARMRDLAAAEQASYVGAGAHGIADEPEAKAGAGNVLDKLLATVPMPDLPTTLRSIADRVTVAANNPSHYGGHRGALDFVKREVGMLRIAADRVHDVISAQPKPAEGGAVAPDGYAYVYPAQSLREPAATVIRFETGGREINGSKPIESIPYYLGKPAPAAATRAEEVEALSESDKDIAVAQAVEFAEYVSEHAKGRMVEAAEQFLSLPYSQEIARRLAGKGE